MSNPVLEIRWTNCQPPVAPEKPTPCVAIDGPAITIWDWNWEPDILSVGLVVTALEELDFGPDDFEGLDYWGLFHLLGPNADGVIDVAADDYLEDALGL
jgi:hypothetical protein